MSDFLETRLNPTALLDAVVQLIRDVGGEQSEQLAVLVYNTFRTPGDSEYDADRLMLPEKLPLTESGSPNPEFVEALCEHYSLLKKRADYWESLRKEAHTAIVDMLKASGVNEKETVHGTRSILSFSVVGRTQLDNQRLKTEMPEIYARYHTSYSAYTKVNIK